MKSASYRSVKLIALETRRENDLLVGVLEPHPEEAGPRCARARDRRTAYHGRTAGETGWSCWHRWRRCGVRGADAEILDIVLERSRWSENVQRRLNALDVLGATRGRSLLFKPRHPAFNRSSGDQFNDGAGRVAQRILRCR